MKDRPFIIGLGELLWDMLPGGKQLGGAPANFAYHAHSLGAESVVISRIGSDAPGREALDVLGAVGLPVTGIAVDENVPTGVVTVSLQEDGQPRFTIHENVAWDHIKIDANSIAFAAKADAICFGSLAQRSDISRAAIRRIVSETRKDALRIFDINLRQQFYSPEIIESSLALANALKLSDVELPVLAAMFGLDGDRRVQLAELARRFDLRAIALTCGASGSLLLADGIWSEHRGVFVKVVDTVGAGDAFTAAWTLGLLAGHPLDTINQRANEIAAFVCSQPGAMPHYPTRLDPDSISPKIAEQFQTPVSSSMS